MTNFFFFKWWPTARPVHSTLFFFFLTPLSFTCVSPFDFKFFSFSPSSFFFPIPQNTIMAADMSLDSLSSLGDSSVEDVCLTPSKSPNPRPPRKLPLGTILFGDPFEEEEKQMTNTPPTLKRPLFQTTFVFISFFSTSPLHDCPTHSTMFSTFITSLLTFFLNPSPISTERPKKRRKSQEPPFLPRPTRFHPSSSRRSLPATSRFEEEYTDREKIGSGSFGQVFKCTHGKSRETFAIKKIDVSKRDKFVSSFSLFFFLISDLISHDEVGQKRFKL